MTMTTNAPRIAIPTRVLNAPAGGGKFLWPAGAWRGAIEDVTEKTRRTNSAGELLKGFETSEGYQLNVKITNNVYLDDEEQADCAGNRKQFVELVMSDGDHTIYDVDATVQNAPYWKLQQSQRYAIALARALGATEEDGDLTVMADGFLEALAAGQYNGSEVGYIVAHSKGFANVVDFIASV